MLQRQIAQLQHSLDQVGAIADFTTEFYSLLKVNFCSFQLTHAQKAHPHVSVCVTLPPF